MNSFTRWTWGLIAVTTATTAGACSGGRESATEKSVFSGADLTTGLEVADAGADGGSGEDAGGSLAESDGGSGSTSDGGSGGADPNCEAYEEETLSLLQQEGQIIYGTGNPDNVVSALTCSGLVDTCSSDDAGSSESANTASIRPQWILRDEDALSCPCNPADFTLGNYPDNGSNPPSNVLLCRGGKWVQGQNYFEADPSKTKDCDYKTKQDKWDKISGLNCGTLWNAMFGGGTTIKTAMTICLVTPTTTPSPPGMRNPSVYASRELPMLQGCGCYPKTGKPGDSLLGLPAGQEILCPALADAPKTCTQAAICKNFGNGTFAALK